MLKIETVPAGTIGAIGEMINVVVEGDVEQPFASVTIISYVPAQSPVKE